MAGGEVFVIRAWTSQLLGEYVGILSLRMAECSILVMLETISVRVFKEKTFVVVIHHIFTSKV